MVVRSLLLLRNDPPGCLIGGDGILGVYGFYGIRGVYAVYIRYIS